jgi:hypothetical protein
VGEASSGVDAGQCPRREGRTGGRGQLGQVEVLHLAEVKWLGYGERPVPELRLGRQHFDADATFPQLPQGQRGLKGRDAPAGDQYPRRHLNHLLRAASSTITLHRPMQAGTRLSIPDALREANECPEPP